MRPIHCILFGLACGFLAVPCLGQDVNNSVNVGTPMNAVLSGGNLDTVQLSNGNLHIEIPLWSVPGRGLSVGAYYIYDNKGWTFRTHCFPTYCQDWVVWESGSDMFGSVAGPFAYQATYQWIDGCGTYGRLANFVLREPNETKHRFAIPAGICGPVPPTNLYAADGSGWMIHLEPPTVDFPNYVRYAVDKHGTVINLNNGSANQVLDTNGNQILPDSTGATIDTLGRKFNNLTYYDSSGTARTIQIDYTSVLVQTNLCRWSLADICTEYGPANLNMPWHITLANAMRYTFNYDPAGSTMGEPTSMTLPTGGQISWTWADGDQGGRRVAKRTVSSDGVSGTWTYTPVQFGQQIGSIIDPAGNESTLTWTLSLGDSLPHLTAKNHYSGTAATGTLLKSVTTDYSTGYAILPIRETTTWRLPSQTQTLVTKIETDWDSFTVSGVTVSAGNPINRREYDWATGAPGPLLRTTSYNYLHLTNAAYLAANILSRWASKIIYDGLGNTVAQTAFSYDAPTLIGTTGAPNHDYINFGTGSLVRGNPTQVQRWLNAGGGTWLSTTNVYDDLGNLRLNTDPGGHTTSFNYADNFNDGTNRNAQAYVTQITYPTTNGVNHIQRKQYFWNTGLLAASCGENFPATSMCANTYSSPQPDYLKFIYDLMNRPASVTQADGGQTSFAYRDSSLPYTITSTATIDTTKNLVKSTVYDGLARVKQTQLTTPDVTCPTIYLDTTYDALGRKSTVSNPHCSTTKPTDGITTYQYDALSRVIKVIPPDGSDTGNFVLTEYCGNVTKVTDQAGKWRRSTTDALGRLVEVDEPNSPTASVNSCPAPSGGEPVAVTSYTYNALDNLVSVIQSGSRQRTFTYNSLSQLTSAINSESGTICYGTYSGGQCQPNGYDADGNLIAKTDARSITITYNYDPLHRLMGKAYSDTTPAVSYWYDGATPIGCSPILTAANGIGRRTAMCDAAGWEAWSFDTMGRVLTGKRATSAVTKTVAYTYNFDGSVSSITYPSGRTVNYAYDSAARTLSVLDQTNNVNYASSATYAPQGTLASLVMGQTASFTGISLNQSFNSRLQPTSIRAWSTSPTTPVALDLAYTFNAGTATSSINNGNVTSITNNLNAGRSQSFTYDELNRIKTAQTQATIGTSCWGLTFGYDIWANLLSASGNPGYDSCSASILSVSVNAKNQLNNPPGFSYDLSGNMLSDGNFSYTWNAESQIATAAGVTYIYDGEGNRVAKSSGKLYWYGTGRDVLDESDASGNVTDEYVYFGGKRIARRDSVGNVFYYFEDFIGSSRAIVQANGSVCYDADFYPYGGERIVTNTCPQNYKFTSRERDAETGLDDFGARYYSSALGRWLSPDWSAIPMAVPYADLANPQTLNLYQFVRNNPETFVDADGHVADGDPTGLETPTGASTTPERDQAQKELEGHNGIFGVARDWLDVIEVSGSIGLGAGVGGQAGAAEYRLEYTALGVEGTMGLGGGNGELKAQSSFEAKGKIGSVEGTVKVGAEASTREGVTASAKASGAAGPLKSEVSVDKNGVHSQAGSEAKHDVKLGVKAKLGIGVGVNVNLSQAGRAIGRTKESVKALGLYLYNKLGLDGPTQGGAASPPGGSGGARQF